MTMLEQNVCRYLRSILKPLPQCAQIEYSEEWQKTLSGLNSLLSMYLMEVYSDWSDGIDGIIPAVAEKTGANEIKIIGMCVLISDQTMAPIDLRLRIRRCNDIIDWLESRLGESGEGRGGINRIPYDGFRMDKRIYLLSEREYEDAIDWVYKITFGERDTPK